MVQLESMQYSEGTVNGTTDKINLCGDICIGKWYQRPWKIKQNL